MIVATFALFLFGQRCCTEGKKTIYVMHISRESASTDYASNIDFALEIFNNDSSLLPDHEIRCIHGEMKSYFKADEVGAAMKEFVDLISSPPTKVGILGPFYSNQAQVVAETARYYHLVQVGYYTTAPDFTDKLIYPYFARTIETTLLHNAAMIKVMDMFNWTRVAKIVPDTAFVMSAATDLQNRLDDANMMTLASTSYSGELTDQIKQLKDSGAKIIFAFGGGGKNNRLLCEAYHMKLYGPRYQWLYWSGRHGLGSSLFDSSRYNDNCTDEMVKTAAEGMLYFTSYTQQYAVPPDQPSIHGRTNNQLREDYLGFLARNGRGNKTGMASTVVDATWTLALALNKTIGVLGPEAVENFSYGNANTSKILFKELTKLSFKGMSGDVAFDEAGDRNSIVVIGQVRDGQKIGIATYNPTTEVIQLVEGQKFIFPGGRPAYDYEVVKVLDVKASRSLYIIMCLLACLGLLICFISVSFNAYYRNVRLIKLSSPRVNSLVGLGCALSYTAIILLGLDSISPESGDWICQARIAVLVFGFTFAFGSMFSKTWRVHVLFTNKKLQKKVVKDIHLLGLILAVLLVDCLILIAWSASDPLHWVAIKMDQEYDNRHYEVIIQPQVKVCTSKYIAYWSGFMYGFKALLLLFGIFFAWETRKVQIEALNDSKHIGLCVYNVVIMSAVTVPLLNLLSVYQVSIVYGITCISIFVCSTTTLILVFGLKMHAMWFGGNKVGDVSVTPFAASLRANTMTGTATQPVASIHVPKDQPTLHISTNPS